MREGARSAEETDGAGLTELTGWIMLIHMEWYHESLTLSRIT